MKIGIITYHRALNYGAVLQCYALQKVLAKLGHEVAVIDFRQPTIEKLYALNFRMLEVVKAILGFHPRSLIAIYKHRRTVLKFHRFIRRYISCTTPCSLEIQKNFDAYIIGSDQMWSFNCVGGYEPVYFGQFKRKRDSKLYGYAISSCGDFIKLMPKDTVRKLLHGFTKYSLREQKIAQLLEPIVGQDIPICLDPTLLLDAEDWDSLINRKYQNKKYVLLYQVRGGNGKSVEVVAEAQKFAESKGVEMIDMSNRNHSIEDFVSAIKYAKYVITTSFHATVFSVIFGIPFVTIKLGDGHDGRYVDLLESLKMTDHLLDINDTCREIKMCHDENGNILKKLDVLRQGSLNFLQTL